MVLIDTHTHIYLPEFEQDLPAVLEKAAANGVRYCLLPAIDSSTHSRMLYLAQQRPFCKAMMGLHPCSVTADFESEVLIIKNYLQEQSFVAIGEIGLDFYWDKTFIKEQYDAFHQQIALALEKGLPVVIHSRNATDECIEVVRQYTGLQGVFHCFSGNVAQAQAAIDAGFYLGIGGVVTFKNSGLDGVIAEVGLDKVVLETDAPYLAPVPYRGKRNEPAYTALVAEKLASITGRPVAEVAQITTENAVRLFNLS